MVSPEVEDDSDGLSLMSILQSFNGPLNEEQAWALCYQMVKHVISRSPEVRFIPVESPDDVWVKKDGSVFISSQNSPGGSSSTSRSGVPSAKSKRNFSFCYWFTRDAHLGFNGSSIMLSLSHTTCLFLFRSWSSSRSQKVILICCCRKKGN